MSLAVIDLRETDIMVQDVATKYGYSSADAFSCAFNKVHNVLPSKIKQVGRFQKRYNKLGLKYIHSGFQVIAMYQLMVQN